MYWGDYLRDTRDLTTLQHGAYVLLIAHYWQHGGLPTDEAQLATIAGVSTKTWRSIRDPIAAKFQPGWKQKRVDTELNRADQKILQRQIAGSRGGTRSGVSKAIKKGQSLLNSNDFFVATGIAKPKQPRTNHKESITTSEYTSAHAEPVNSKEKENDPARSLATALPSGALARALTAEEPTTEKPSWQQKPPAQVTRAELEAMFALRRGNNTAASELPPPRNEAAP